MKNFEENIYNDEYYMSLAIEEAKKAAKAAAEQAEYSAEDNGENA